MIACEDHRPGKRVFRPILAVAALVLALGTGPARAEDLPQTSLELWRQVPSYDVQPGKYSKGPFCREMLKDLKHHPEKFTLIPPKVETNHFDDPQLQQALPGCSRKELTFAQGRNPITGAIVVGIYADEGFAVWPLSYIDPSYPANVSLVWKGPEYGLEGDNDKYLPPGEPSGMQKWYGSYGRISAYHPKTCELIAKYGVGTLASYEPSAPKIRNMFVVQYEGDKFLFDVYAKDPGEPYISTHVLSPSTGRPTSMSNPKSCAYFAE